MNHYSHIVLRRMIEAVSFCTVLLSSGKPANNLILDYFSCVLVYYVIKNLYAPTRPPAGDCR